LSFTWPRTMDQIPFDLANLPTEGCEAPLFPFGYGLDVDSPPPSELSNCIPSAQEVLDKLAAEGVGEPKQPQTGGPILDDFEGGSLPAGKEGYAQIGYITWSDGSAVSIKTVQVGEGDDLALPDQSGSNTILQLDTDIKSGGWGGFTNAFANESLDEWITQDWSPYEGIAMWLYGNGTGAPCSWTSKTTATQIPRRTMLSGGLLTSSTILRAGNTSRCPLASSAAKRSATGPPTMA